MKYALLIYADETGWDSPEDQKQALLQRYEAFSDDVATAA